jgi:nucleotide-binding universal stress UspA family protein
VTGSEVSFVAVDARPHVERAQAHLQLLANQLLPAGLVDKLVVRVGVPYHEIVQAAGELQADLLVITTHGHTGLKHVYLGGTAEWVVRHAPWCPGGSGDSCW